MGEVGFTPLLNLVPALLFRSWSKLTPFVQFQLIYQVLNFAMIIFSALMIWKGLMVVTGSESPIVVVLRLVTLLSDTLRSFFFHLDILAGILIRTRTRTRTLVTIATLANILRCTHSHEYTNIH